MRRKGFGTTLIFALAGAAGCGPSILLPIEAGHIPEIPRAGAIELLIRGVPEPIPLSGSSAGFSGLSQALERESIAAAEPWAVRHADRAKEGDGWQLLIELTQVEAHRRGGLATVTMALRANLRTRVGNQHLAQTQAHCMASAQVAANDAASVFKFCLRDLGTELSRWLGGIKP